MASARLVFLVALVALLAVTAFAQPTSRILEGEEAAAGDFSYAASVRLDGAHFCGGTIVSENYILTAAHCVADDAARSVAVNRLSVRVGSTNQFAGGKIVYVSEVIIHSEYGSYKNDVAMLKLSNELVFTDKIASIPIATSAADEPPVDAEVTVAGWGEQSTGGAAYKLQFASFIVASEEVCTEAFSGNDETILCLSHELKHGSCRGDAGNSAVYNGKAVGVSSFVVGACGTKYPDVFANVEHFADWINGLINA